MRSLLLRGGQRRVPLVREVGEADLVRESAQRQADDVGGAGGNLVAWWASVVAEEGRRRAKREPDLGEEHSHDTIPDSKTNNEQTNERIAE